LKLLNIRNTEVLTTDGNGSRLFRSGALSKYINDNEDEIDLVWIISSFDHYNKHNRSPEEIQREEVGLYEKVKMLKTPGYKSNLSLLRFWDHCVFGFKLFFEILIHHRDAKILYCGYPTIESSFVTVFLAKIIGAKSIIDIRDKWPDVFFEGKGRRSTILKLCFLPYFIGRNFIFKYCDSIVAANQSFLDWASFVSKRSSLKMKKDAVFPIGYTIPTLDKHSSYFEEVKQMYEVTDDELIFAFGGTIGTMFDFETIKQGLDIFDKYNIAYRLFMFGDGDSLHQVKELFSSNSKVIFLGRVNSTALFSFYTNADILIAPYIQTSNFLEHIPNKISEYLAAKKPILTSLSGLAGKLLESEECGHIYRNPQEFADCLQKIDKKKSIEMGNLGYDLYLNNYQLDAINKKIVRHCSEI
tara:strand:+ start:34523 stop:35761 length:1239 start_codon:yes stop_codon:yes gene_type:complete